MHTSVHTSVHIHLHTCVFTPVCSHRQLSIDEGEEGGGDFVGNDTRVSSVADSESMWDGSQTSPARRRMSNQAGT